MKSYKYIFALVIFSAILVLALNCKKKEEKPQQQLPPTPSQTMLGPVVAGQFYPSDPPSIKDMIATFFKNTPDLPLGSNLMGAVSPHAGYIYSGPVAAYIYRNLPRDAFSRVVIVFPSHHSEFRGVLALDVDEYKTPLGSVKVDRESIKNLMSGDPAVQYTEGVYDHEHSMEVMLPFLQTALGDNFKIIPLMMGDQTPNMARRLAEDLFRVFGDRRVLYIASSDMSHYHPYDDANALDSRALTDLINLDDLALVEHLRTGQTELCGYGPVLTLMNLLKLRGGGTAKVLKHANSGDTQGDKDRVVGYGSVAFFTKTPPREDKP